MKTWLTTIFLASLVVAGAASAAIQTGDEFLAQVQQRVQAGTMSPEQALLTKFQYAYDRSQLPADLVPAGVAPLKCGTDLIQEYLRVQSELSTATRSAIDGYINPPGDPSRIIFNSPSGHFRLYYSTSGVNGVPAGDSDGDLVPDYIENMAGYFDYVWQREVVELGFGAPPGAFYTVLVQNLSGIYGSTSPTGNPGETTITIENDFVGFPPNDDPDGDVVGAAKVTAAHEFKHATQYVTSNWSEGGWVELDATWCEDIIYPLTNDYHNYLPSGSPISNPATSLDSGGTGSYEDCVWQLYMSDLWTTQIITDFWNYRRTHQAEAMLTSYNTILTNYGSSIVDAWPLFTTWNYATGPRYVAGFGHHDAADYPAGSPTRQMMSYPQSYSGTGVQHLAANFIRCLLLTEAGKHAQVTFNGANSATAMSLTAFVRGLNSGYWYYNFDLDANNDGVFVVPNDLGDVYEIGFIVGNAAITGAGQGYGITVEKVVGQSTPVGAGVTELFHIAGNLPNPFNPSTTIAFAVDQAGPARLDLFDLRGQRIRTLVAADLAAGNHEARWDGLDDQGRSLSSGTYVARLSSHGQVTTHKLVLAK